MKKLTIALFTTLLPITSFSYMGPDFSDSLEKYSNCTVLNGERICPTTITSVNGKTYTVYASDDFVLYKPKTQRLAAVEVESSDSTSASNKIDNELRFIGISQFFDGAYTTYYHFRKGKTKYSVPVDSRGPIKMKTTPDDVFVAAVNKFEEIQQQNLISGY